MSKVIRVAMYPYQTITVSDEEYGYLRQLGVVLGEAQEGPLDPTDAQIATLIGNELSQTFAKLLAAVGNGPLADSLKSTYAPSVEVRARDISPTQDLYGASTSATAAANSAAINAAIAAGRTSGARVVIPGGTYQHNGLTLPADGHVDLEGAADTTLVNNHASNHSIAITGTGTGGSPYAEQWSIRRLRLKKAGNAVAAGQRGLSLTLCTRFSVEDVYVDYHDTGFYCASIWRGLLRSIEAENSGTGLNLADAYAGSTPLTVVDGHMSLCSVGLLVENNANAVTWVGGDFTGCALGARIRGNGTRDINLIGLNFESITGAADVEVGSSSPATAPAAVLVQNCRFHRTTTGAKAIHFIAGGPLLVDGGSFDNYTDAIYQSNVAGTLDVRFGALSGVTNPVNSQTLGVLPGGGHLVSTPSNYARMDPAGVTTVGPLRGGDGTLLGPRLWSASGYGPWPALGSDGDFFLQGGGAPGSRLHTKVAGAWTGIL